MVIEGSLGGVGTCGGGSEAHGIPDLIGGGDPAVVLGNDAVGGEDQSAVGLDLRQGLGHAVELVIQADPLVRSLQVVLQPDILVGGNLDLNGRLGLGLGIRLGLGLAQGRCLGSGQGHDGIGICIGDGLCPPTAVGAGDRRYKHQSGQYAAKQFGFHRISSLWNCGFSCGKLTTVYYHFFAHCQE